MSIYTLALPATKKVEGFYSNNRNDRGKETYKGISRRKNPNWPGWKRIDALKNIHGFPNTLERDPVLQEMVLSFYKENYWDTLNLDLANNQRIANDLFDTGVLCGVGFAALSLQRILNVANQGGKYYPDLEKDGVCGPATIKALNKHPRPSVIFKALNCILGEHLLTICEHDPSQEDFFNGWIENRVFEIPA